MWVKTTLKNLKTIPFGNKKFSTKFATTEGRLEEVLFTRLNEIGILFIRTGESRNISLCAIFLVCMRYVLQGEFVNNLLCFLSKSSTQLNIIEALYKCICV
jgi:hypothetical protein